MNDSENEDLMNDFSGFRDNNETKRLFEKQQKEQCKRPHGRLTKALESTSILLTDRTENLLRYDPDINTIDQSAENDFLLENNEIEEIVAKLSDKSSYMPETAHTTITYLQLINEPAATEEILNDEKIISIIQADENEKLVEQEIDKDEVPDLPVIAAEVFNAMQIVIYYEEQENSESNLSLKELGFLRNLLKEYKCTNEISKNKKKLLVFLIFKVHIFMIHVLKIHTLKIYIFKICIPKIFKIHISKIHISKIYIPKTPIPKN
ncbi:25051_t:CDS:2 [Cetraspora pellucida]|uniref:25051_t:CDS:1 n=1 Tax=Cetraspora pellucida TaxID=1433469 RepID=A0A9N9B3R4_9GLOM|nr:25051_t:CDS:2 [Cetraspora pellucida]